MLTVRELIGELDVRLLAGETGLDLPIRWVHMSELLDPTPWLSGGEVLLTTGMLLDGPERQREFIELLADHQLAGLGFGTGFGHERVPEALLDAARERDFPVFEVPYEVPFIAITEAAFSKLVNEQYAVLRRALSAQERLERVVLSERGLEALAGTLATLRRGERARLRRPRRDARPARLPAPARHRRSGGPAGGRARPHRPPRPRAVHAGDRRAEPCAGDPRRLRCRRRRRRAHAGGLARCGQGRRAAVRLRPAWLCARRPRSSRSSCCASASPETRNGGLRAMCSPACWQVS